VRIEVVGTITREELLLAYRWGNRLAPLSEATKRQRRRTHILRLLLCLVLAAILIGSIVSEPSEWLGLMHGRFPSREVGITIGAVGLLFLLVTATYVLPPILFYLYFPKDYRRNWQNQVLINIFTDTGLIGKRGGGEEFTWSWDDVVACKEHDSLLFFFAMQPTPVEAIERAKLPYQRAILHFIPRRFFTGAQWQELHEFLASRCTGRSQPAACVPVNDFSGAATRFDPPADAVKPPSPEIKPG